MSKDLLNSMAGKVVKINRGGPESKIGKLLDINDDHLILLTKENGVVYYLFSHIKSITDNVKDNFELNLEIPADFVYKKEAKFQGMLETLKFQWVGINQGGPEKLEGVLIDVHPDYVSIIHNNEIVRVAMFHINSISYGLKIEENKEDEKNNDQRKEQSSVSDYDARQARRKEARSSGYRRSENVVISEHDYERSSRKEEVE